MEGDFFFFWLSTRIQNLYFFTEDSFLGKFYIYWALEIHDNNVNWSSGYLFNCVMFGTEFENDIAFGSA